MAGEAPRQGDSLKLTTSLLLGVFTKPSISAHPGPLVQEGRNVTLRCHTPLLLDKFMLHKKGSTRHFQTHGETLTGGHAPAGFSISPMTSGSAGTYRCYGSLSRSPMSDQPPATPWTSSSQVSVSRPVPSAVCVTEGLVSSPASVPGDNDRHAETLTHLGEATNQRERRCEHGREREQSTCHAVKRRHGR